MCAVSKEDHSHLVKFPTYRRPFETDSAFYDNVTVWEAARATSAGTTLFDEIAIGSNGRKFLDGATRANNPIHELWKEAQMLWNNQPLEEQVQCIVSIGSGIPRTGEFKTGIVEIYHTLKQIATETERNADEFAQHHQGLDDRGAYIRLNVQQGLQDVAVEDSKSRPLIAAATERYTDTREVKKIIKTFKDIVLPTEGPLPPSDYTAGWS